MPALGCMNLNVSKCNFSRLNEQSEWRGTSRAQSSLWLLQKQCNERSHGMSSAWKVNGTTDTSRSIWYNLLSPCIDCPRLADFTLASTTSNP
jgi:hypothetical protein